MHRRATLTLLPLLLAFAAPSSAEAPAANDPLTAVAPVTIFDRNFDLDFPGGTLEQLLAGIEKSLGERPNFVVGPKCNATPLPPIGLRGVTLRTVLLAVDPFLQADDVRCTFGAGQVVIFSRAPNSALFGRVQRVVRPFDLSRYLESNTVDDIVTAIETAWELLGDDPQNPTPPSLKYHQETRLLLAAGSHAQLNCIQEILAQLAPPPAPSPAPAVPAAPTAPTAPAVPEKQ